LAPSLVAFRLAPQPRDLLFGDVISGRFGKRHEVIAGHLQRADPSYLVIYEPDHVSLDLIGQATFFSNYLALTELVHISKRIF
jgi:hypothetical protein